MKHHHVILEQIQNVDLDDTETLDEIDAKAWCFVKNIQFKIVNNVPCYKRKGDKRWYEYEHDKYTRSRDALKSIRPEGWIFLTDCVDLEEIADGYTQRYTAHKNDPSVKHEWAHTLLSNFLPTEELAELHAIIQAIAYERNS